MVTDGENTDATAIFLGDDGGQCCGGDELEHCDHRVTDQGNAFVEPCTREAGAKLPVGHAVRATAEDTGPTDSLCGSADGIGANSAVAKRFRDDPA